MGEGWGTLCEKPGEEKKSGINPVLQQKEWVSGKWLYYLIQRKKYQIFDLIVSYLLIYLNKKNIFLLTVHSIPPNPTHPPMRTCFSVVQKGRFPRTNSQLSILGLCNITWLEGTQMDFIALKLLFGLQIALRNWSIGKK